MINTKYNTIHLSSDDIRKLLVKNVMNSVSNDIANSLLKHNRANTLFICLFNEQFQVETKHINKDRLFIHKMQNPMLKASDSSDVKRKVVRQLLTAYFNLFSNDELVDLALKQVDDLIDQETLKQWLITDYFTIENVNVKNYLVIHCLDEFSSYWLSNFNQLVKYIQADQEVLDKILNPFVYENFKGTLITKTFIYRLAEFTTATYPDYFCDNLILAIMIQFNIKNDHQRIVLPFKYFMSYIKSRDYDEYNRVKITFKLTTTSDLAQLMTFTNFMNDDISHLHNQLKSCTELKFDIGKYKSNISTILNDLKSIYYITDNKDYSHQVKLINTLFRVKKEGNKDD